MSRFISGYIEGYYGRLFTFEERIGIARKLGEIGATHYLYAPKEDTLHRRDWRKPYPTSWRKEFKTFLSAAKKSGVTVIPGLAPGLSYRYQSEKDFGSLLRKLKTFLDLGCKELALLMDDIPERLPKEDQNDFHSLGEAHALLLTRLRKELPGLRLWFCPTVYCDAFAELTSKNVSSNVYLHDLAIGIPRDVEVMWTGPNIISKRLAPADLNEVNRVLDRRTILWDNLYANDYCPGKIFLGPFLNRPASVCSASAGMMLNPTGLYQTDLFLLDLLGGFLRGENPKTVWSKTVRKLEIPPGFLKIAVMMSSPFEFKIPASKSIAALRKALKPLIWDWKSPLQREWYPYLYSLDADLRLLETGKNKPDVNWIRKKYSPIIAKYLYQSK